MKAKRFNLVTISDIADCVNYDNLDAFLVDLRSFLNSHIALVHLSRIGAAAIKQDVEGKKNSEIVPIKKFIWIDDGKHNHKLTVEIISPTPKEDV